MSTDALEGFRAFLADVFRDVVREVVREVVAEGATPRFATSKRNPLGNARKFLEAGRRKAFPMRRVGRENVALWKDVEEYMESCPEPKGKPRAANDIDISALLAEAAGGARRRSRG
jgi:hypothetical protein